MPDIAITGVTFASQFSPLAVFLNEPAPAFDLVYAVAGGGHALADATDILKSHPTHILMNGGGTGEWVSAAPLSNIATFTGPTLVQAGSYVVSANAGKMAPRADLVSTNFLTEVFVAQTPTTARLKVDATDIQEP